jgi:hypothetical protein
VLYADECRSVDAAELEEWDFFVWPREFPIFQTAGGRWNSLELGAQDACQCARAGGVVVLAMGWAMPPACLDALWQLLCALSAGYPYVPPVLGLFPTIGGWRNWQLGGPRNARYWHPTAARVDDAEWLWSSGKGAILTFSILPIPPALLRSLFLLDKTERSQLQNFMLISFGCNVGKVVVLECILPVLQPGKSGDAWRCPFSRPDPLGAMGGRRRQL